MKRKNDVAVFFFFLLLIMLSCSEQRHNQLVEFNKYKDFIEKTSKTGLNRALKHISQCSEKDSALLNLKETILDLNENSNTYLSKVDNLKSLPELEVLKEELAQSVNLIKLGKELLELYSKAIKEINLESFSVEEARIVLKANLMLTEIEIREKMLSQWAIDC